MCTDNIAFIHAYAYVSVRNCSAAAGIDTDIVGNYLKIIDVAASMATLEYEVVLVTKVVAKTLTVRRAQGGEL